jgi:uncharacterized protein YgfB (UPF0149 family)
MADTQTADFDSIEHLLIAAGASWEAAEAHGAFCGRACLEGAPAIRAWANDLLSGGEATDVLAAERKKKLETLAANALLSLEAGDMSFEIFVPGDEEPLIVRTAGLVDWCHGFMHGLVAAGGADQGRKGDALDSEVVSEILDDFSEITKAGAVDDASEDAEFAYVELIEYVRVSAQLVYDETAKLRAELASGGSAGGLADGSADGST